MSTADSDAQEAVLVRKRAVIKTKLTNFCKFIDGPDGTDVKRIEALKTRMAAIEIDYGTFDVVQGELELITAEDNFENRLAERTAFDDLYFELMERAHYMLSNMHGPVAPILQNLNIANPTGDNSFSARTDDTRVKLPTLQLPTFSGSYESWPGFADAFKSAVDENPNFRDIQKLMYLRSCLKDRAANKIEQLQTTGANYAVAWSLLKKHYDKPNTIIMNRVKAFFEIPASNNMSADHIERTLDIVTTNFRALEALNKPFWHAFPVYAAISKPDESTRAKWKERTENNSSPTVDDLIESLHTRLHILGPACSDTGATEKAQGSTTQQRSVNQNRPQQARPAPKTHSYAAQTKIVCHICKGSHFTQGCDKLRNIGCQERFALVRTHKLCLNCLKPNHLASVCTASTCKKCNGRHNTLLYRETEGAQQFTIAATTTLKAWDASEVLLSTARVYILDKEGKSHSCRILLDSASQSNFITEKFASILRLRRKPVDAPVSGIGEACSNAVHEVEARLKSRGGQYSIDTSFLVLPTITEHIPYRHFSKECLDIPHHLRLADPQFNNPAEIDALIGARIFYKLLEVGRITLADDDVALVKTKLGWVVTGEIPRKAYKTVCNLSTSQLHDQISKFWEIEEGPLKHILSIEEAACEEHYQENTRRDPVSGKYVVRLPFNDAIHKLGVSYDTALKRFLSMERSLHKRPEIRSEYVKFLREYESLGHMSPTPDAHPRQGYYLPHHAVLKNDSSTTKLRVVFDASATSSTGISLNNALVVGPTIQEDLFSLLIRFRSHKYVLTADVAKMYRQILMHRDDRPYQKILWRENPKEDVMTFTLNTVTYGTSAASFLATRSLHQLAHDEASDLPLAAKILREDFYVDDLLTGAQNHAEITAIIDQLIEIFRRGGMDLRKWASNDVGLINNVEQTPGGETLQINPDAIKKALGIQWDLRQDTIVYTVIPMKDDTRATKRSILSQIAQLFDPLGLLGPVITRAKIIMQSLWLLKIDWDETVPMELHTIWMRYRRDLALLHDVKFERMITANVWDELELHGFADASEKAYGACIYLRSVKRDQRPTSQLICSRSSVVPLKSQSLPRLELCATLLLAKLFQITNKALRRLSVKRRVFWSDSTIALSWIASAPHTLKTFVANRVAEIQTLTSPQEWRHIPSADNPADHISRGLMPAELINNALWRVEPSWLAKPESDWPAPVLERTEIPEKRPIVTLVSSSPKCELLTRFSSIDKLKRVLAYCLRFRHNLSNSIKKSGILSTEELQQAMSRIVKLTQHEGLAAECHAVKSGIQRHGRLAPLSPFVDGAGILRVGGRLAQSNLPFVQRHPALLPRNHVVTEMIIRQTHAKNFHAGAQATLDARQAFWVTDGRIAIKRVIHKCVTCRRAKPITPTYLMGNLAKARVTFERPFLQTGVDYCGPILIKEKRHRNRGSVKVYIAVFVCLATRTIHIEVVSDLTTEAFLAALRRFFARRGKSRDLYSDNASNFVGANRELKELHDSLRSNDHNKTVAETLSNDNIRWHFIPPCSPHFGGLWEASVIALKHHLTRIVANSLLTFEVLVTYVTEVEAILNSRPLTPLSADPNDLSALTPAHFLIGDSLNNVPDHDLKDLRLGRLSSWQHALQMKQHFWTRWSKEYLHELTVKKKWHSGSVNQVSIGALVTIRDDHAPPMQWRLGRIIDVHPGEDGIIRVVSIKTARGEIKRSLKSVAPLFEE